MEMMIALVIAAIFAVLFYISTKSTAAAQQPGSYPPQAPSAQPSLDGAKPSIDINLPSIDWGLLMNMPLKAASQILELVSKMPILPSTTKDFVESVVSPEPVPIGEQKPSVQTKSESVQSKPTEEPKPFTLPSSYEGSYPKYWEHRTNITNYARSMKKAADDYINGKITKNELSKALADGVRKIENEKKQYESEFKMPFNKDWMIEINRSVFGVSKSSSSEAAKMYINSRVTDASKRVY